MAGMGAAAIVSIIIGAFEGISMVYNIMGQLGSTLLTQQVNDAVKKVNKLASKDKDFANSLLSAVLAKNTNAIANVLTSNPATGISLTQLQSWNNELAALQSQLNDAYTNLQTDLNTIYQEGVSTSGHSTLNKLWSGVLENRANEARKEYQNTADKVTARVSEIKEGMQGLGRIDPAKLTARLEKAQSPASLNAIEQNTKGGIQ